MSSKDGLMMFIEKFRFLRFGINDEELWGLAIYCISKLSTILLPVLVFPFIFSQIGGEKYGLLAWFLSCINLLCLLVRFGFDFSLSATIAKTEKEDIKDEILAAGVTSKLFISFLIWWVFFFFLSSTEYVTRIFLLSGFLLIVSEALMTQWFHTGRSNFTLASVLSVLSKVLFGFCVLYLWVVDELEFDSVLSAYALAHLIVGILNFFIIRKNIWYALGRIKTIDIVFRGIDVIRQSCPVFLATSLLAIRDAGLIVFLERSVGLQFVGLIDLMMKFFAIITAPMDVISTILLPGFSSSERRRLGPVILLSGLIVVFGWLVLLIVRPYLESQFGFSPFNAIEGAFALVFLLSVSWSSVVGTLVLLSHGWNKQLLISTLISIVGFALFIIFAEGIQAIDIGHVLAAFALGGALELLVRLFYARSLFGTIK